MDKKASPSIRTAPLRIFSSPRKIPFRFLRWGLFLFLLALFLFAADSFLFDRASVLSGLWLIVILLCLISCAKALDKQNGDQSLVEAAKLLLIWLKADEYKLPRFQVGTLFIFLAPVLFILHLFFITHVETISLGDLGASYSLGYETTLLAFKSIILLPWMWLQVPEINPGLAGLIIPLWILSMVFSIGNVLLVTTFLFRRRLRSKKLHKKYMIAVSICTIFALISPDITTFYFGYALWLIAFIALLCGLLLIRGYESG